MGKISCFYINITEKYRGFMNYLKTPAEIQIVRNNCYYFGKNYKLFKPLRRDLAQDENLISNFRHFGFTFRYRAKRLMFSLQIYRDLPAEQSKNANLRFLDVNQIDF